MEVESGRKDDWPQLAAARVVRRQHKARLVIAKLDRLARSVAFISGLMESGVDFVATDRPDASRLTVHVPTTVAEHERGVSSQQTREARAAAKARRVRLSVPRDMAEGRVIAAGNAARFRAAALLVVQALRTEGRSLRAVVTELNARGIKGQRVGAWHVCSVQAV